LKIPKVIRRAPKIARNFVRDMRYGRPLGGTVRTRYAHLGACDIGNADYDDLAIIFSHVEVTPDDVLVDVGCGKGRSTNWFLSRYPRNTIYAIELDPDFYAATAKRLRRHTRVKMLCGDATALLPAEGTIFYLFNPFNESVMTRFIDALLELKSGEPKPGAAGGRPTKVVYYNYKFLDLYRDNPRFEVETVEHPSLSHKSAIITLI
jgi:SAM-dependent methyltransferase